jgi:hypothetical protein
MLRRRIGEQKKRRTKEGIVKTLRAKVWIGIMRTSTGKRHLGIEEMMGTALKAKVVNIIK